MKSAFKIIFLVVPVFFFCFFPVYADTLYLKNGRSIEGIVVRDDADCVELKVCLFGSVKFKTSEVFRVEKTGAGKNNLIQRSWERQEDETNRNIKKFRLEQERQPREIEFSKGGQVILLNTVINGKIEAKLALDTGAAVVMLSRKIAKELGVDLEKAEPDMKMQVADGRHVNAKHVLLESIKVQGAEEMNVDAVVLLEEVSGINTDGLLGMSFLKRFNFEINHVEQKLILKKI